MKNLTCFQTWFQRIQSHSVPYFRTIRLWINLKMVNKIWRIRVQLTRVPDLNPNPGSWLRLSSENSLSLSHFVVNKEKMNFWWCPDVILLSYEHKLVTKYSFWSSYEIQISKMRVFTILIIFCSTTRCLDILEFESKLPGKHRVYFRTLMLL